jgi:uncharacterized protein DUF4136
MRRAMRPATLVAALALGASMAFAGPQVKIDYDRSVDFAPYKTFSIKIGTRWGNEISEKRVLAEVTKSIAATGWTESEAGGADVEAVLHGATDTKKSLDTFYNGWGGYGYAGWGGGMSTATTTVHTYEVGTLVIDFFDGKSKQLIWRGTASDYLSTKTEKNQKTLQAALRKLFADFPPAPQKKK